MLSRGVVLNAERKKFHERTATMEMPRGTIPWLFPAWRYLVRYDTQVL